MPSVGGGGRAAPLMMSGRAYWRDEDEHQSDHTFRLKHRTCYISSSFFFISLLDFFFFFSSFFLHQASPS